ncbi:hypothetical protein MycrhDRAFT_4128 [Mycolicibacterium rhodesiae JS60]|nr:hypothetical protein MycrhDRAFT_4128 [Mycolicibacterium rhodesiae JS60]
MTVSTTEILAGSETYLVWTDESGFAHLERRWTNDDGLLVGDAYVLPDYAAHAVGVALIGQDSGDEPAKRTVKATPRKRYRMA